MFFFFSDASANNNLCVYANKLNDSSKIRKRWKMDERKIPIEKKNV